MYFYSIQKRLKHTSAVLCFLILVAAAVSCTNAERPKREPMTILIESKSTKTTIPIEVEPAKEIPDGTGMIFVFKRDQKLRFWMKDTPHPLSIAFIDSTGRIREIYDMQPFSLDIIASTYSVRYALEVAQGYFERAGINAGDKLSTESLERLKAAAE